MRRQQSKRVSEAMVSASKQWMHRNQLHIIATMEIVGEDHQGVSPIVCQCLHPFKGVENTNVPEEPDWTIILSCFSHRQIWDLMMVFHLHGLDFEEGMQGRSRVALVVMVFWHGMGKLSLATRVCKPKALFGV